MKDLEYEKEEAEQTKGKISPFAAHLDMKVRKVRKPALSEKQYKNIIKTGEFQPIYSEILSKLYQYGYLNGYLLREVLSKEYPEKYVMQAVKWLVSKGFLIQYEFSYLKNEKESVLPKIYSLSSSGFSIAEKNGMVIFYRSNPQRLNQYFTIYDCLCTLACNQFHIFFKKQYGEIFAMEYYGVIWEKTGIPGAYKVQILRKEVLLYVFAIRRMDGFGKRYLETLRRLKKQQDKKVFPFGIIIVICDVDILANEAQKLKNCENELKDMIVYYVNDTSLITGNVLGRLIEVPSSNGYQERRYFEFSILT